MESDYSESVPTATIIDHEEIYGTKRNKPMKNEYYMMRAMERQEKATKDDEHRILNREDEQKLKEEENKYKTKFGMYNRKEENEFLTYYYSKYLIRQRASSFSLLLVIVAILGTEIYRHVVNGEFKLGLIIGRGVVVILYIIYTAIIFTPCIYKTPVVIEMICVVYTITYQVYQIGRSASLGLGGPHFSTAVTLTLIVVFQLRLYCNLLIVGVGFISFFIAYVSVYPGWWIQSVNVYIQGSTILVLGLCVTFLVYIIELTTRKLYTQQKTLLTSKQLIDYKMEQSEAILQSLLPKWFIKKATVATSGFYQQYENTSILFIEMLNSKKKVTSSLLNAINTLEIEIDRLAKELNVEKLKSVAQHHIIMSVGESGSLRCAFMAYHLNKVIHKLNDNYFVNIKLRMGIAQGPITICLLGTYNLTFEAFGSVIREAFELESKVRTSSIAVSSAIYEQTNHYFDYFEKEGMYMLTSPKKRCSLSSFLADPANHPIKEDPKTHFENLPPVISHMNLEHFLHERNVNYDSSFVDMIDMDMYKEFVAEPDSINFASFNGQEEMQHQTKLNLNPIFLVFHPFRQHLEFVTERKDILFFLLIGITICIGQSYMIFQNMLLRYYSPSPILLHVQYAFAGISLTNIAITCLYLLTLRHLPNIFSFLYVLFLVANNIVCIYLVEIFWNIHISYEEIFLLEILSFIVIIFMPYIPFVTKLIIQNVFMGPILYIIRYNNRRFFDVYDTVLFVGKCIISIFLTWVYHYDAANRFKQRHHLNQQMESLTKQTKKNKLLLRSALPTFILKNRTIIDNIKQNNQQETMPPPISTTTSEMELSDVISSPNNSSDEDHSEEDTNYYCNVIPKQAVMVVNLIQLDETNLETVKFINDIYAWFDLAGESLGCEKIHSVGFQYYCTSSNINSIGDCALVFGELVDIVSSIYFPFNNDISYSIGVHVGEIANVGLGFEKLKYDLWGPTIAHARKLAAYHKPGRILISEAFAENLPKEFHYTKITRTSTPNHNQQFFYLVSLDRFHETDPLHHQKNVLSSLSRPVSTL